MRTLLDDNTSDGFKRYWKDHMFPVALRDVRKEFLQATGFHDLSEMEMAVIYLLMLDAFSRMVAGYSGAHHRSDAAFHEAVGLAYTSIYFTHVGAAKLDEQPRYHPLYQFMTKVAVEDQTDAFMALITFMKDGE